jgi:predicted metal-dependent phosphoesterase TrpH
MSATEAPSGEFANFVPCAGAEFHRADLHVHSYGISSDVSDEQMTPPRIVQSALERDIGLLAITDHNAIGAVAPLCEAARKAGLAVLAGVELTGADGHLLAYFNAEDLDAFGRWFARLNFKENPARRERWLLSPMHELADQIAQAGGLAVPAHIGRKGTGVVEQSSAQSARRPRQLGVCVRARGRRSG